MKIKKLTTYNPVVSMKLTYLDGKEVELRRCGLIYDLFASEDGKLYQLRRPKVSYINGQPTVRYWKNNIMAKHMILDAWRPGWEADGDMVKCIDGDNQNLHVENLEVVEKSKGRPRSNHMIKQLTAVEMLMATEGDFAAVAAELDATVLYVETAVRMWAPWLIESDTEEIGRRNRPSDTAMEVE